MRVTVGEAASRTEAIAALQAPAICGSIGFRRLNKHSRALSGDCLGKVPLWGGSGPTLGHRVVGHVGHAIEGTDGPRYFGYDPDDYDDGHHDTDDYEDEDHTYGSEANLIHGKKGGRHASSQASARQFRGLGSVLEGVPRETVRAVLASTEGTAAVFASTAREGFHQVKELAREAADAARESPAVEKLRQAKERLGQASAELPEGVWGKIAWVWDLPPVKSVRITITAAQWGMHIPTLLALAATQWSVLFAHVSPTMLAPLLFGAPMLLRSITTNASIIFPRIGVTAMVLWVLWSANGILQSAVYNLRKQGRLDYRLSSTIITCTEILSMITALVIILSMFGINVSALFFPAGIAIAFASKDLVHNFLAGFFLLAVQPFKVGDNIGVNVPVGAQGPGYTSSYFEGNCFKVDLRFTHIRRGHQKLVVPNANFLTNPFIVIEEPGSPGASERGHMPDQASAHQQYEGSDGVPPTWGPPPARGGHVGPMPYPPGSGNHVVWPATPMPQPFFGHAHGVGGMEPEQHFMESRPFLYDHDSLDDGDGASTAASSQAPGSFPNPNPTNAGPPRTSGPDHRRPPPSPSPKTPRDDDPPAARGGPAEPATRCGDPRHAAPPAHAVHAVDAQHRAGPAGHQNGAYQAGGMGQGQGALLQQYGPYRYGSVGQYNVFGQYGAPGANGQYGPGFWVAPERHPPAHPAGGQ